MTTTEDRVTTEGRATFEGLSLAELAAKLYHRGWMEGTGGNVSVRQPGTGTAVITASGRCKGELTPRDVVVIRVSDASAVCPGAPKPSAEAAIHAALYRLFPECGAVVHAHPPYSIAAAAGATGSVRFAGLEIIKGLGVADPSSVEIPLLDNDPDVDRIAARIEATLGPDGPPALLIAGHGVTTWGPTLEVARDRLECVEALGHLTHLIDRRLPVAA